MSATRGDACSRTLWSRQSMLRAHLRGLIIYRRRFGRGSRGADDQEFQKLASEDGSRWHLGHDASNFKFTVIETNSYPH
jgi:hypothetical protein